MLERRIAVWTIGLAVVALTASQAGAVAMLYSNSFDDLTGVLIGAWDGPVDGGLSSTQVVDGPTSLRLGDPGANSSSYAEIDLGGPISDPTTTIVYRMYVETGGDDHANQRVRQGANDVTRLSRGYPIPGLLGLERQGAASGWAGGPAFPVDQWVTIGLSMDLDNDLVWVYFAPGTTLTTANLWTAWESDTQSSYDNLQFWTGYGAATDDWFIDQIQIFDELDTFVPEPATATVVLLGLAGVIGRRTRR